ncbi:MAG: DUF3127 domain-containing protein [Bacteroidia bacterium]|nr:DUF3127 domain-containing protein [Bacteroidia bacterium]
MDIIGKLYRKGQVQTRGANGFQFREFIIEVANPQNPAWNNYVPFQISGNSLNAIDNFNEGDELQVTFDIRGRMWTNPQGEERCIMNLNAWRINAYNPAMAGQMQGQMPGQMGGYQTPMNGGYQQPPMGNFQQPAMQPAAAPQGMGGSMPDAGGDASGLPF